MKFKENNDKVDSLKLEILHLVDMLSESHLLNQEGRIFGYLLIQGVKISLEISSFKNSIIRYPKRKGLNSTLPESIDSFSQRRIREMRKISFSNQKDPVLETMVDRLEFFERRIDPKKVEIKKIAKENHDVRLIMTIPGIDTASPLCCRHTYGTFTGFRMQIN